jgi:hypothetical protein
MADFVTFFFDLSNNIKLYHWNTTSFARHKASDELFEDVARLSDSFMEIYMGKYGRPKFSERGNTKLSLKALTDKSVVEFIRSCITHLNGSLSKQLAETDTDLLNIRDEVLGKLNQTLYLFSLS